MGLLRGNNYPRANRHDFDRVQCDSLHYTRGLSNSKRVAGRTIERMVAVVYIVPEPDRDSTRVTDASQIEKTSREHNDCILEPSLECAMAHGGNFRSG